MFPERALTVSLIDGLLTYKATITGTAPGRTGLLEPGTYYSYVDFVQSPDFNEGRWVSRIVDSTGKIVRVFAGVRQLISLHVSDQERQVHEKPSLLIHGLAGDDAIQNQLFGDLKPALWLVTGGDWHASGNGYTATFFCHPAPE